MVRNLVVCSMLLSFFVIISIIPPILADEIKATDQIKKNPAMIEMLKKIELSKKILAQLQEGKKIDNTKTLQMQEIRSRVKASLDEQVNRMNNDFEAHNSQNAFARFVSKKPSEIQPIYQGMFDYQQEKISLAKAERDRILAGGGKFQDAWDAYYKISATKKVKLVQLNKDYNIRYANANSNIQNMFDEKGKLPRTD